jgi:hypothetical protein
MTDLLDQYGLKKKKFTYVKDEGSNLNVMTRFKKFVANYEVFGPEKSFQGT